MPVVSQTAAIDKIARAEEFTASALTGRDGDGSPGRLYGALLDRYLSDRATGSIAYVVKSYGTPIAYLAFSGWVILAGRYSRTTGKHLSTVRRALATKSPEEVTA